MLEEGCPSCPGCRGSWSWSWRQLPWSLKDNGLLSLEGWCLLSTSWVLGGCPALTCECAWPEGEQVDTNELLQRWERFLKQRWSGGGTELAG